jgi:multiple sugar transport system substrate-binding protein
LRWEDGGMSMKRVQRVLKLQEYSCKNIFLEVQNMKKGIILTILAVCVTAALFAGGGQAGRASGEKVRLIMWTQDRAVQPVLEPLRVAYNEKNTDNIYLEEFRMFTDDFYQAIELTVQTGGEGMPDLFAEAARYCFGNTINKQGWFLNLDKWLETHTTPADQEFKRIFSPFKAEGQTVYDGDWIQAGTSASPGNRLIWNRDIFKKAGLPDRAPETLEEMVQFARQITTALKSEGIYGFSMNMKNPGSAYGRSLSPQWFLATGINNEGYQPTLGTFRYDTEEGWAVLQAWQELLSPDIVFPGSESLDIDPLRAQFADGKIGMYISYGFDPMVYMEGAQFPTTVDYSLAKIPVPGGNYKGKLGVAIGGRNIINARSAHLEEAWIAYRDFFVGIDTLAALATAGVLTSVVPEVNARATRPALYANVPYANFQPDIDQWAGIPYLNGSYTYEGPNENSVWDEIIQNRLPRDRAMALLRDLAERRQRGMQLSIDRGEYSIRLVENYNPLDFSTYTLGAEIPKSR